MNLKALYENLLNERTQVKVVESVKEERVIGAGERIYEGLKTSKPTVKRRKAVRLEESEETKATKLRKSYMKDEDKIKESSGEVKYAKHKRARVSESSEEVKYAKHRRIRPKSKRTERVSEASSLRQRFMESVEVKPKLDRRQAFLESVATTKSRKEEPRLLKEASDSEEIEDVVEDEEVVDAPPAQEDSETKFTLEDAIVTEEFETPQDEFEVEVDAGTSNDSVDGETSGFTLEDAIVIEDDLVLTIAKDSGHMLTITVKEIDLEGEDAVFVQADSQPEKPEEVEEDLEGVEEDLEGVEEEE